LPYLSVSYHFFLSNPTRLRLPQLDSKVHASFPPRQETGVSEPARSGFGKKNNKSERHNEYI